MIQFDYNSFSQYFRPKVHSSWLPVAKVGGIFILIGLLVLLLKQLLIAVISAGLIGIGIFILTVAFRIWYAQRDRYYQ